VVIKQTTVLEGAAKGNFEMSDDFHETLMLSCTFSAGRKCSHLKSIVAQTSDNSSSLSDILCCFGGIIHMKDSQQ